jgi:hypothetical protein
MRPLCDRTVRIPVELVLLEQEAAVVLGLDQLAVHDDGEPQGHADLLLVVAVMGVQHLQVLVALVLLDQIVEPLGRFRWEWDLATLALLASIPVITILAGYLGLSVAALQIVTPNQMRAFVAAIFQLFVTLLGLGLGPTIVALLTDWVFADDLAINRSLTITMSVSAILAASLLALGLRSYRTMLNEAALWTLEPSANPIA